MLSESHTMLAINQLRFQWKDNQQFTPSNSFFNFNVKTNEIVGLSAPSGFGKTTLLNYLLHKNQTDILPYHVLGSMICSAQNISYLPQFAQEALHPTFSIAKQIKEFQNNLKISSTNLEEVKKILIQLGFKDPSSTLKKTASELSGGQKQRICLLLLLLKKTDLLILDEPTAALDQENAFLLFNFLKVWCKQDKKAVLCISHQGKWIKELCDHWVDYNPPPIKNQAIYNEEQKNQTVLSLKDICYSYSDKNIISNFNAKFECGKLYAISGNSGKGKSTLGKIISGHLTNYQGLMKGLDFNEQPSTAPSEILDLWRSTFAYIPQNSFALLKGSKSFLEEMQWISAVTKFQMPEKIMLTNICKKIKLEVSVLNRPFDSLSGGERQKLSILQFLLRNPKLLIIDEPTASLDESSKEVLIEFIRAILQNFNICIILLTHDEDLMNDADMHIQL